MIDDLTLAEKQFADIKAAEYIGKGYEVSRDAPLEFLPGYSADLLVKTGHETKVIEIKTRPSLVANPALRELERIINSRPGWSFELQLVGEPERVDALENAQTLDESAILSCLEQAGELLDAGSPQAAFMIAWSAAEATVRMLVSGEGIAIERATNPAYILGMAVAHGAVSRDDYYHLLRIMEYRNAIAHGFEVADFNDALITELITTVNKLLCEYHASI